MAKLNIGVSNGPLFCVFGQYDLGKQISSLCTLGIKVLEVNLFREWGSEETKKRIQSVLETGKIMFYNLAYFSLHAPDFSLDSPENQIKILKEIMRMHKFESVVIHPLKIGGFYPERYYQDMVLAGIPLAIENMDITKNSGFSVTDLARLIKSYKLRFVLDVQHAFERDHTMQYAKDLFSALAGNLFHLHVSGQTKDNVHSLVCKAENAKAIIEFLGWIKAQEKEFLPPPIILEGRYETYDEIAEEIRFLEKELA